VPLPLHPNKPKSRGYNQSALLARHIASTINASLNTNVLVRVRETENQAGLARSERIKNVQNAFDSRKQRKLKDKTILLIDDVITSTATIREASSTLLKAGAKSVSVLSLARSTGVSF
jgi:competence protein ComFC